MLGRTNLLFVAGDNTSELAFTPDYILTSASGNILKIEYINDLFFVFTEDEKVLYGSDMNNLQTLKNGNEAFAAKHIIHADGVYYMTKIERTTGKAIIYKSSDLISYEVITLKTGTSSYSYPVHGLFLDSKGEIVAFIEEYKDTYSSHNRYLLIVDTLAGYQEESASFIEVTPAPYNKNTTAIGTRLKKDRIFTYIHASSSYDDGGRMISLDGTMSSVDMYSFFALDYFFKVQSHSPSRLYYSLNGTDYISLEFSNDVTDFNAINVFEYGGTIALIYKCTENGVTGVSKLTTAATPKELIKATASAIPVTIDYGMIANSNVYVDDYVYLGSTGGIVIKGKIDNAETERPDVVVVKGMAAKEALKQANDYTDEKYKTITKEVELHEETTKQYMENAFHATPEGYAELVDTVSENKVKIDTIIEKADLRIKADASGEEIHLTDSDDDKAVEFALYGKAKQNTTTGKNLLPNTATTQSINGVTFTVNNDGSIEVSGTATDSVSIEINTVKLPIGKYKFTTNGESTEQKIVCFVQGINGTSDWYFGVERELNLTQESDIRCRIYVYSGVTVNAIYYPMIRLASITDDTYEPFTNGASPNPQYPQPIEVSGASGSVAVKSCGKNFFDGNLINAIISNANFSIGTASEVYRSLKVFLKKGTYTVSFGKNVNIVRFVIDGQYSEKHAVNVTSYVLTLKKDGYMGMSFRDVTSSTTLWDDTTKIQVERGTVATPYAEYQEPTTATIPTENGLAGIKVTENGNYTDQNGQQWICDEVVKYADGSGKKVKRFKYLKVTSIQSGHKNNKGDTVIGYVALDAKPTSNAIVGNVLCNRCVNVSANEQFSKGLNGIAISANGRVDLSIVGCTTTNELRTYISENDVYILYELATPIETPLTAEEIAEIEKLSTFYPVTNISNDGACDMKVTYVADSKNYIDRMVAEQVASIVANMNN